MSSYVSCDLQHNLIHCTLIFISISAYEDYKAAFQAGDDGRPDWMARKACNYMTGAVEVLK